MGFLKSEIFYKNYQEKLLPTYVLNLATKNAFLSARRKNVFIYSFTARRATGFKGLAILSYASGISLGAIFGQYMKHNFKNLFYNFLVKGRTRRYISVFRGIAKIDLKPVYILRVLNVAHNGCR